MNFQPWSGIFVVMGMQMQKPTTRILFLACLSLIWLSSNVGLSRAENPEASSSQNAGFEAAITGSYEGKVSGTGVLMLLPEAGFEKQGYFFLADGQGIRPHGVTFVLPRGLTPGKYTLESPSPFDIERVPSVRVDRDMGDSVLSSERNTSGFLNVIAFPDNENRLSGSDVMGSFEFETEDSTGQKITVKGAFSFQAK